MILLAFPGMGKTPLAKSNGRYLDLDFGFFRTALKVHKDNEQALLSAFARMAKSYENSGYIVLSNEPKLMSVSKIDRVYLPKGKGLKYAARKLGTSESTTQEWVTGWAKQACKYNVPVTYVEVGLDHYLRNSKGGGK